MVWLCLNHEDYKNGQIDEERIAAWALTEVAVDLMESIASVSDPSAEDASRTGFASENLDSIDIDGDISFTASGMVDVNNITVSPDETTLLHAADLRRQIQAVNQPNVTVNVTTGSTILDDHTDPTYFTSAFPTLFPYGCGKHLDERRTKQLSFHTWLQLLLRDSSQ